MFQRAVNERLGDTKGLIKEFETKLERELRDNIWLICDADEGLLFGEDHEHKWTRALAKLGISADHLSAQAGRA